MEAYFLISFIYQDNTDKIQHILKKGFSFGTGFFQTEKKIKEMEGVLSANSNDKKQLKLKLELILFCIESTKISDQTNIENITEINY